VIALSFHYNEYPINMALWFLSNR